MPADGSIGAPADPSRWRDARAWFLTRRPVLRESAAQTERDARLRAFRVAGITSVNLITEVHQAIDDALRDGTTLDEFKKRVGAKLAEEWGAPNARRVETIFRTNVQSAYNAGRYAEMTRPAVLAVRPFWKYVAILDGRTTATCAPLNGVIAKHDDDFWKDHFPPLHFNCRSTVVSLSRGETERAGGVKPVPDAKKPGKGFGTRPDLAGTEVEPTQRAGVEVRAAHDEKIEAVQSLEHVDEVRGDPPPTRVASDATPEERAEVVAEVAAHIGGEIDLAGLRPFVSRPENKLDAIMVHDQFEGDHKVPPSQRDDRVGGFYDPSTRRIHINRLHALSGYGRVGPLGTQVGVASHAASPEEFMARVALHELMHHAIRSGPIPAALLERVEQVAAASATSLRTVSRRARMSGDEWLCETVVAVVHHPQAAARLLTREELDLVNEILTLLKSS